MRYDMAVYFRKVIPGEYNDETGDYEEPTVRETKRIASGQPTSEKRMMLVYGKIREDSRTISLLNPYRDLFDLIRIGDTLFTVDRKTTFRNKQAFVVSEVQTAGDD